MLRVEGLRVAFPGGGGGEQPSEVEVVRGVDLSLHRGEMLGLVGESGCGKTLTALALLDLLPPPGRRTAGRVWLGGDQLADLSRRELRRWRGGRVAMVFQEPASALNPVFTVGFQVAEAVRAHRRLSRSAARARAVELLRRVALPDPERRYAAYPHQLSGGQRQRVMIAMALAGDPEVLLADEPTTALDVTVQAQILDLLDDLRRDLGLAVLLITHDLAVVAQSCDRVAVMYAGRIVEAVAAPTLFSHPAHPYTAALLAALPRLGHVVPRGGLTVIPGRVPDPADPPSGCAFHPRCPRAMVVCPRRSPQPYAVAGSGAGPGGHQARCFLHDDGLDAAERPPLEVAATEASPPGNGEATPRGSLAGEVR